MNNKIRILSLSAALLAAIGGSIFALAGSRPEPSGDNSYLLRDYDGYVAVFVENRPELPVTVTDIPVSTLRELDRKLVSSGMRVDSHEDLMMLLEDLGS